MEEKIWADILENTQARKVIAILPSRELCVVCRSRNIWIADVQHGVIAHKHPWYGAALRSKDPIKFLPNSFLLWDQGSADVITTWADPLNVDVKIIGNRWLARFILQNKDDKLVATTNSEFKKYLNKEKDPRPIILVTLSWSQEGVANGIIADSIINIIQKTHSKYRWLLRLHSNQITGFASNEFKQFLAIYKNELDTFCEWEIPTKTALPAVLLNTDLHITWHSSVVMEAAQYGIRSATLDPRLLAEFSNDYFEYHKKLGYIDFIVNEELIIEKWIEENIAVKMGMQNFDIENKNYEALLKFLVSVS